jgi:predicted DCC family thiol-disulfide oxidoreductase YuxK
MANELQAAGRPVVLFDGACTLCNGAVRFLVERDRAGCFRFAALQSEAAAELLRGRGPVSAPGEPESLVLIEGTEVYTHSDAALRIARGLDGAWPLLGILFLVPRSIRDAVYRFVARRRYRWFGRTAACPIFDLTESSVARTMVRRSAGQPKGH